MLSAIGVMGVENLLHASDGDPGRLRNSATRVNHSGCVNDRGISLGYHAL